MEQSVLASTMTRRRLLLAGVFSLSLGTLLSGCGGGGGGGEAVATRQIPATLALPGGFAISPAQLRAQTGAAESEIQADGAFPAHVLAASAGPTLAWIRTAEKVVLLGFIDADHARIDAHSTAAALLYFALGGFAATPESKRVLLDRLQVHPAAIALGEAVAARLAVNPTALADGDDLLGAALKRACETLLAERPARARAATRARQTAPAARTLVAPPGLQSNIEVLQGAAPQTLVATNHARRYCQVMTYEVDRENEAGVRANPAKARLVSSVFLPSTGALSFLGTATGFFSGQTAFVPVSTDPIALQMNPGDARTFFETVVLGASSLLTEPAFFGEARYADEAAKWRSIRVQLNLSSWLLDVLLGLLLEFLGARDLARNEAAIQAAVKDLGDFLVANYFTLYEAAAKGQFVGAVKLCLQLMASEPRFADYLRSVLVTLSPALRGLVGSGTAAASSQLLASAFNAAFAAAGLIIGAGDIGATLWDLAHAEQADRWQATLVLLKLTLSPPTATIDPGESLPLTASIPTEPGVDVLYKWSLTGNDLANLGDAAEGKAGREFETRSRVVTLATTPSTKGTITVGVEAFAVAAGGARTSLGSASSTITVSDEVPFGKIRVKFTRFDAGGQNVTGETRLLTPYETPRKQVQGALTFITSTHWNLKAIGNDDSVRMVAEFATKQIVVGSTATFRDAYGLTMKLATGRNTEVYLYPSAGTMRVTEVGNGYIGFTMDAELKGLSGAATNATAQLRGWISGYTQ